MADETQESWEVYMSWLQSDAAQYQRNISYTRARIAGSGIRTSGAGMENILDPITKEYDADIAEYRASATYEYLERIKGRAANSLTSNVSSIRTDLAAAESIQRNVEGLTGRDKFEAGYQNIENRVSQFEGELASAQADLALVMNMSVEEYFTHMYGSDAYEAGAYRGIAEGEEPGEFALADLLGMPEQEDYTMLGEDQGIIDIAKRRPWKKYDFGGAGGVDIGTSPSGSVGAPGSPSTGGDAVA